MMTAKEFTECLQAMAIILAFMSPILFAAIYVVKNGDELFKVQEDQTSS